MKDLYYRGNVHVDAHKSAAIDIDKASHVKEQSQMREHFICCCALQVSSSIEKDIQVSKYGRVQQMQALVSPGL